MNRIFSYSNLNNIFSFVHWWIFWIFFYSMISSWLFKYYSVFACDDCKHRNPLYHLFNTIKNYRRAMNRNIIFTLKLPSSVFCNSSTCEMRRAFSSCSSGLMSGSKLELDPSLLYMLGNESLDFVRLILSLESSIMTVNE